MLKDKDQSWGSFLLEIAILIALVLFIRVYVFQFFRVSGPSMCPTLNIISGECQYGKGEFIFVNEFLYSFWGEPTRGEIIIFRPPNKKKFYIKRVIGIPGDTVEIRNGRVYLTNDEVQNLELPEPYLSAKNRDRTTTSKSQFVVPEEYYLLFGDNRLESLDARRCFAPGGCNGQNTPFVSKKNLRGRAEFIIWPIKKMRWLEHTLFEAETVDELATKN